MKTKKIWHIQNSFEEYNEFIGRFNVFLDANNISINCNYALNVAVEELVSNIIKYNPSKKSITIDIGLEIDNDEIGVSVSDNGGAFDLDDATKADLSLDLDEIQIGGLGLDLVKKLFHSYEYHYLKGCNNVKLRYIVNGDVG